MLYKSIVILHDCVCYATKYNVLSTFGNCLHQGLSANERGNKISNEKFYRKLLSGNYLLTYCRSYISMLFGVVYAAVNKYNFFHV